MKIFAATPRIPLNIPALFLFVVICLLVLMAGCSTRSAQMAQQVEQQTHDQKRIQQVMEALQTTEARIAKAQADNVELYAPRQIEEAKSALNEARRYYERFQADPQNVNQSISLFFSSTMGEKALELIAKADAALTQAESNKQQADSIFADVNENFVWLKKFQAPLYFQHEYQDLEQTHQELIQYVARDRMNTVYEDLPRLLQEQRALEVAAAQRFYLNDIGQRIEKTGQYTLDRFAPISYSRSLAALNKARATVAKNPRDEATIRAAKHDAEFSINIAQAVASDMQKLTEMDRREMERWLILVTTQLREMGMAMGAEDVRNHELIQQVSLLADAAKQKQNAAQPAEQVAKAEPASTTPPEPEAAKTPAPDETRNISSRINELEQTLAEQVKALSEQLNAMKAENKSALAEPPAAERATP